MPFVTKLAVDILVGNQNAFRHKADSRYIGRKPKCLSSQSSQYIYWVGSPVTFVRVLNIKRAG